MQKEQDDKPHKNEYLIYARKSTDDKLNQKNSIPHQVLEMLRYAKLNNLPIAQVTIEGFCTDGIIREKHTAYKEEAGINFDDLGNVTSKIGRPKFRKLITALVRKEYKGVIFLCWDRASRNNTDTNLIQKIFEQELSELHFVQEIFTRGESGEMMMSVNGMVAKAYSKKISVKVTATNRKMRDDGICTYRAPIGYLNTGDPRHKPFDPERAPLVRQLFEKCAEGDWSLADLAKYASDIGLTTPPARRRRSDKEIESDDEIEIEAVSRPLRFNHVHKILTNFFFIAKVKGNDGEWVDSTSHEALIPDDLFYVVQGVLRKKKVSKHYKDKLYFAYRGLIRCGECQRVYSPYMQKGIAYYGARCVAGCKNKNRNINDGYIEETVGATMYNLNFTKEELVELDSETRGEVCTLEDKRQKRLSVIEQRKHKLRADLTFLRTNKLSLLKDSVYNGQEYLAEETKIAVELEKLRKEEEASDVSMQEVVSDVVFLSELLEDAYLYYTLANPTEKQQIITKVFSELTLFGNTFDYKCRNGFKIFETKKKLIGDSTGNRTPITALRRRCPNR